ncbi:MAG: hypothetical protein QXJ28_00685 [Candidatus Pacearchaeota archaeon]
MTQKIEKRYREKELLEREFKEFLFEFIELIKILTKEDIKESLKDKILKVRNYAKKIVDELDEMYVEELKQ